jgi:hypothetical protein
VRRFTFAEDESCSPMTECAECICEVSKVDAGEEVARDGGAAGGRGRLARVIATRGGLAPPEAPFVIEHREALIYMLCEAAELEHGIMCQ